MPYLKEHTRTIEINTQFFGYITNQFTFDAAVKILCENIVEPDDL